VWGYHIDCSDVEEGRIKVPSLNVGGRLEVEWDGGTVLTSNYKTSVCGIGAPKIASFGFIDRSGSILRALRTSPCPRRSRGPE
jgi:hypothetical protein